ncbi:hypothetical protein GOBAR_AA24881 [Gossypium barbadense]|uniref:Uncharacterized protein n=1 Tax=Gossypium barbadense TaxID=3634 RepID=A0A2P5WXG5_GOSBA|nr:hypothetical protein GOBAR_AA24881 [Gossypium barbadense]
MMSLRALYNCDKIRKRTCVVSPQAVRAPRFLGLYGHRSWAPQAWDQSNCAHHPSSACLRVCAGTTWVVGCPFARR